MKKILVLITASLLITACTATSVKKPAATGVVVSSAPAPQNCQYLGQLEGSQGNFFTGGWTSNKSLDTGAMNDLRNHAFKLGANYVQLLNSQAGSTAGTWGVGNQKQTNMTFLGNAYKCPPAELGLGGAQ